MAIIQRIQQSKQCFYTVLLLALALLNGLYSQAFIALPIATHSHHSVAASHLQHSHSSEHALHETAMHAGCGSDAVCKSQCAWHCQLSQAMQPLPTLLNVPEQIANQLPVYNAICLDQSLIDLSLRPPISIYA